MKKMKLFLALMVASLLMFGTSFASNITKKAGGTTETVKCAVFQAGYASPYYSFGFNATDVTQVAVTPAPTIVYFADAANQRFNGSLGTDLVNISTNSASPTIFSKSYSGYIIQIKAWRVGYDILFIAEKI